MPVCACGFFFFFFREAGRENAIDLDAESCNNLQKYQNGVTLMIKASSHLLPVFVDKHQSHRLLQRAEKQNICHVQDCEKKRAY